MIIDCHGHYTTAPDELGAYRDQQRAELEKDPLHQALKGSIRISDEAHVDIDMSLTAPGCPVAGEMPGWVADAVEPLPGVKQVNVELVWEPPWGMDMMSDEARLELGFM